MGADSLWKTSHHQKATRVLPPKKAGGEWSSGEAAQVGLRSPLFQSWMPPSTPAKPVLSADTSARTIAPHKPGCVACNYSNNADVVAAINNLERGHRLLACVESALAAQ